jgi:hypothetical protein
MTGRVYLCVHSSSKNKFLQKDNWLLLYDLSITLFRFGLEESAHLDIVGYHNINIWDMA